MLFIVLLETVMSVRLLKEELLLHDFVAALETFAI